MVLFFKFIYLFERPCNRKTVFHPLVGCGFTSQMAETAKGWARLKPAVKNSIQLSHIDGRDPNIQAICCCLAKLIRSKLDRKESSWDLNWHSNMGCLCRRQKLNPYSTSLVPNLGFLISRQMTDTGGHKHVCVLVCLLVHLAVTLT